MGKDAIVSVPTAELNMTAKGLQSSSEMINIHFVPVPDEALLEVQEVLKKYPSYMAKVNEALRKLANKGS